MINKIKLSDKVFILNKREPVKTKFKFGKYKGQVVIDVINDKNNYGYINWCNLNIENFP